MPVRITIEDVQNNGQFIKLLTTLTQHISEDGMCQTVSCDLKEVLFLLLMVFINLCGIPVLNIIFMTTLSFCFLPLFSFIKHTLISGERTYQA